jgi:hypothetical protein
MGWWRSFRRKDWSLEQEAADQKKIEAIEFHSEDDRLLFAEASIGIAVHEFWFETEAGKYLKGRAAIEVRNAIEELVASSPSNPVAIANAQVRLRAARQLVQMVNDAINGGAAAEQELRDRES